MRGISLSKVYEASFAIFLAALLVSLRWESLQVSLGLAVGTGLALAVLASWQVAIRRAFAGTGSSAAEVKRAKVPVVALALLKLPVMGAVVYLMVGRGWVSPIAFAAGVAIPQIAVTVMAIGGRLQSAADATGAKVDGVCKVNGLTR